MSNTIYKDFGNENNINHDDNKDKDDRFREENEDKDEGFRQTKFSTTNIIYNNYSETNIRHKNDDHEDKDNRTRQTDVDISKSMFEGSFKFNNTFLKVTTNNKQLLINTCIIVIRHLNNIR